MTAAFQLLRLRAAAGVLASSLCLAGAGQIDQNTNASPAPPTAPTPIPALPTRSPVETFRSLLAMTPLQRREFMAARSPEHQKLIEAKIREYEDLTPNVRELRLRSTELRWYLLPLMQMHTTNRTERLQGIPADLRGLIEQRLRTWDELPSSLQREVIDNEAAIRYFSETHGQTEQQRQRTLASIAPSAQLEMATAFVRWRSMPEEKRMKVLARFEQFFELSDQERETALKTLSAAERRQIERTLADFSSLPPAQRAECIRALQRFADMPAVERQQFLRNAEQWRLMQPDQRHSWRELVNRIKSLPPLPPGAEGQHLPPTPPTQGLREPAAAGN